MKKPTRKQFIRFAGSACLAVPPVASSAASSTTSRAADSTHPSVAESGGKEVRYDFSWDLNAHARQASRRMPRPQSLYMDMGKTTPPVANMDGEVRYYSEDRIRAVRERVKGIDRKGYLQDILDRVLPGARSDRDRVAAICGFVGKAIYYNPIQCPIYREGSKWAGVRDPIELLELHDGRCGGGVIVTRALLDVAGIESRTVAAVHHTSCEARYDGGWHLADALMFGTGQPQREGTALSVEEIRREPYFVDSFPVPFLYRGLEEYLTEDGFRALGYVFGEWGSTIMPYMSYYWGAPFDSPPTLPCPLVTQRMEGQRVRLNWARSFKAGGGKVEYRIAIYADRDCRERIQDSLTPVNHLEWDVPETNRIYYFEVTALDDHRRHNPQTWYLPARNNFALVPPEQYGWYGVV